MNRHQRAWRYTLGTLLGCLLLALVWWMVRNLGGDGSKYGKIIVDDPAIRRMAEETARIEARRRERQEKRPLVEASVPWVRSAALPEAATVEFAAAPFVDRSPARPLPARVYPARVPPIGKRYSLANPDPVKLHFAVVPWTSRPPRRPVVIEPSRLPHLSRLRDIHAPDVATVTEAAIPWRSDAPGLVEPADLSPAALPWVAGRAAGEASAVVVAAQVPSIRPKPDPARPRPARVQEAQTPWSRDAANPLERHVYEAHVPSRLRTMTPGGN